MLDLKPCPFCGGEAVMQEHVFVGYRSTYGIVCLDCCCETRQFYDSATDAIKAWNRRSSDAVSVIRCSECQYYEKRCPSEDIGWCNRPGAGCGQTEDFWCAGAERKDEK